MTDRLSADTRHVRLVTADPSDADPLAEMAHDIWHRHYFPDILSLAELEYLWQRTYRPDALREQMRTGAVFQWIECREARVGFLSYRLDPESNRLWLSKLYLLPEYHGRGIGAFALSEIKRAASALGAHEIQLYVFRKNEQAIRAYLRAGFEIAYEDYSDAGEGFFYDDYVMSVTLTAGTEDAPGPESR